MKTSPHHMAIATIAFAISPLTAQIAWTASLDAALERARTERTVIAIAINMPGERASDELDAIYRRDVPLARLAERSACVMLSVGPEGKSSPDERRILETYLKAGPDENIAVPHHIFVDPQESGDGRVISSVPYALTAGQLEWAWVDAIRKIDPDFVFTLGDRARAPERLRYDGVDKGDGQDRPAPTDDELDNALKELKKGGGGRGGGWRRAIEHLDVVIRSPSKEAMKYATTALRGTRGWGAILPSAIRAIGDFSPELWWKVVAEYSNDRDPKLREESARALERLGAIKSLPMLKKQLRGEDDENVEGRLLRAIAAVGPTDKAVAQTLTKTLAKHKSPAVRAQAAAAASVLETPETVRALLEAALADADGKVRAAAAFAIASRRDPALVPLLEEASKSERDPEAQGWIRRGIEIVKETAELDAFDPFRKQVLGDRDRRQKFDAAGLGGGRGGRNPGGDGTGGGDEGGQPRPGGRRRR